MAVINGDNNNNNLAGTVGDDVLNGFGGNDILFGDNGLDIFNGGNGDDRFDVTTQAQVAAGETYNGGLGFDTLFLNTGSAIDLSATIIGSDVESLLSFGSVSLTSLQLGSFQRVQTGVATITDGGLVDLSNSTVFTGTFNLAAAGNTFTLAGTSTSNYTVNGNAGADSISGGDGSSGDLINGAGGDDTLNGGLGNDVLVGGADLDAVNGGGGDDRLVIVAQADIVAGESYTGGDGFDRLDLDTGAAIDISSLTVAADVEYLESNGAVSLTAAQLGGFTQLSTGAVTLTTTGTADLSGATVFTNTFNLNVGGNALSLAGVTTTGYTVNGSNGNDTITGGDIINGDDLRGGLGADSLSGGLGNDFLNGGDGKDTLNGGGGDDRLFIVAQGDVAAGESYVGGDGFDTLDIETGNAINISAAVIGADVERLESNGAVSLLGSQLSRFTSIQTGAITITNAGLVNLSGDTVSTGTFNLNAAGNTITLLGVGTTSYLINGGAGNDVVTGGESTGGDDLRGNGGDDRLTGGAGNDLLTGGAGKDTLSGGFGDDRMVITAQSDIVAAESYLGGTGVDKLDIETSAAVNIATLTINADVEQLESNGAVSLTSAQLSNFKSVNTGAITLTNAGTANLSGDSVFTTTYNLFSGGNTITFAGNTNTGYTVIGGAGADVVTGGDSVFGDDLRGGGGDDRLTGGLGNDALTGGAGKDTLSGGVGNDRLIITAQTEIVAAESYLGGVGVDTLDLETSGAINIAGLTINADVEQLESNGVVTLTGAQLAAFKNVSTGQITLTTGGTVSLVGDRIFTNTFNLSATATNFDLTGASVTTYTVNGGNGADTINGGDNSTGDLLSGGGGADLLNGLGGNDLILGGVGADTVDGGGGADRFRILAQTEIAAGETYSGGAGFDILDLETAGAINIAALTIGADIERLESSGVVSLTSAQLNGFTNVATGIITLTTGGTVDLSDADVFTATFNLAGAATTFSLAGVADTAYAVNGGAGSDSITGGDQASGDALSGAGGNDTLVGGAGNDLLTGGAGRDSVSGGIGDDRMVISLQTDILANESYAGGAGIDKLDIETVAAIDISSLLINADVEQLESGGAVSLKAAQLNNFQSVQTGEITLTSAGAADLSDAIFGVGTQVFNLFSGGNTIDLTGQNANAYIVNGGAGVDVISGGDRPSGDRLVGAGGNDQLRGGGGADDFVYTSATLSGADTILDFSGVTSFGGGAGDVDQFRMEGLLNGTFDYIEGGAFTATGNSQARFAGAQLLQIDTNGNGVVDISITVTGLTDANQLVNADFSWT